tara:strand:+ start:174 stop:539 length:366 start_codon:yes stop_codon:yes gene_type:complete
MKSYELLIILFLLFILCCGFYKSINTFKTIYKEHEDPDLIDQKNFNLDKMNPNRWNYGNPDFAPYIDGSYKQVTNNYVPGFNFNNYSDKDFYKFEQPPIYDVKINAWKNKSNNQSFLVQCK